MVAETTLTENKVHKDDFLNTIFLNLHDKPKDTEHVCTCPAANVNNLSSTLQHLRNENFFCVSTINGGLSSKVNQDTGEVYEYTGRKREHLVGAYCIVLDDVGTKSKAPDVMPHWVMETSPGNEQWGYMLEPEDMTHEKTREYYEACVSALAEAGYSDPGAHGAGRVMRLPGSRKERGGHKAACTQWRPEMQRYDLGELMEKLSLEPLYNKRRAQARILHCS